MMRHSAVLALLALPVAGCGQSPLLHHVDAPALTAAVAPPSDTREAAHPEPGVSSECPLEFPQSGLCASAQWSSGPSAEDSADNELTLRFWSRQGGTSAGPYVDPAAGLAVVVQLWMPAMGHGSSPTTVTRIDPGVYDVQRIYFIMPGAWDINVKLMSGHSLVEQAALHVSP